MIPVVAFLALAGALVGASTWIYLRAEPPVAGRGRLAMLRGAALVVLAALLADLRLPSGASSGSAGRWVLLDASASMAVGAAPAWDGALARARALEASGWVVLPFGRGVGPAGSGDAAPTAPRTELGPALRRVAEAGAAQVRVLSDLRFMDGDAVEMALASLPVEVAFEGFGSPVANAGVAHFVVDDRVAEGAAIPAEVSVFSEAAGDSLEVVVLEEGVPVVAVRVAAPSPGHRAQVAFELPPARAAGRVRYVARAVLEGDGFPEDDEAVAYAARGAVRGGVVVVSLRPDWEPRSLVPILEEATGLPGRGFLRVGADRFVSLGRGAGRGGPVSGATVRQAAEAADLLVVHGLAGGDDGWAPALARGRGRVVAWPADAAAARAIGLAAEARVAGAWLAAGEVPPSPVRGGLGGADFRDLPPLTGLIPLADPGQAVSVLHARRGPRGPEAPAVVLMDGGSGRRAVVLASGLWRWAAGDGGASDAYRRLWSAVAGWLLAGDAAAVELRPERWVQMVGEPVRWIMPAAPGDSLRLRVVDGAGAVVADTVLATPSPRIATPPFPPGLYHFHGSDGGREVAAGRFDVEGPRDEMAFPPRPLEATLPGAPSPRGGAAGRPLRASSLPYLLILLLLSAEWVGRRRAGLR